MLPATGHTFGSSALVAEIDGRTVAFTGDLLPAGGDVATLALEPGAAGTLSLALTAPEADSGRVLVTAEILVDGRSHGPIAEALVSVARPGP